MSHFKFFLELFSDLVLVAAVMVAVSPCEHPTKSIILVLLITAYSEAERLISAQHSFKIFTGNFSENTVRGN